MEPLWLRAADCSLLQADAPADEVSLRLVQRLLETSLTRHTIKDLAGAMLEEVAATLNAEQAGVWEATPEWHVCWQFARRGVRAAQPPARLLGEVLDREAGVSQPATAAQPALLASCLSFVDRPNQVLLVQRPRES